MKDILLLNFVTDYFCDTSEWVKKKTISNDTSILFCLD